MSKNHFNTVVAVLILLCMFQFFMIVRLIAVEPSPERDCIPLYGETGYECCK